MTYRARRLVGQGDRWKRQVAAERHRQHLSDLEIELLARKRKADEWASLSREERRERINEAMRKATESLRVAIQQINAATQRREAR